MEDDVSLTVKMDCSEQNQARTFFSVPVTYPEKKTLWLMHGGIVKRVIFFPSPFAANEIMRFCREAFNVKVHI